MFIVLLVVGIGLLCVGTYIENRPYKDGTPFFAAGTAITIVSAVACFILGLILVSYMHVDERIALYETENMRIECEIAATINEYIAHESDMIEMAANKVTPESAITVVAAYPELNSSALVAKRIEIYAENNKTIKTLKDDKIGLKSCKWLLYFGG